MGWLKMLRSADYPDIKSLFHALDWSDQPASFDTPSVVPIIKAVQSEGDEALYRFTQEYDGCDLRASGLRLTEAEIGDGLKAARPGLPEALRALNKNLTAFHKKQVVESWFLETEEGVRVGQIVKPISRVGVYIPGGRAAYPSTVFMTVVPAKVAGVEEIVACVPPDTDGRLNPGTILALHELKVKEIYKVGGAQAIAAMAYGTQSVPRVDKIVGPGNAYVVAAKKELYGTVGIDLLAGPSELVVMADDPAESDIVVGDLLSQAEHGPGARSLLITVSQALADAVVSGMRAAVRPMRDSAAAEDNVGVVLVQDHSEAVALVNLLAPEHLEMLMEDFSALLSKVRNAGAIFLGRETSVVLGDYAAGTNHVLPTGTTSRFSSPLGVRDFQKSSNVVFSNHKANRKMAAVVRELSEAEGLPAHSESLENRIS